MEKKIQELREKIKQRKRGFTWEAELRKQIVLMANRLYQQHKNWGKVGIILGLQRSDLYNLRLAQGYIETEEENAFAIAILEEEEKPEEPISSTLTVSSPNGFQLQGLNFEQALKAMEVLSCSK